MSENFDWQLDETIVVKAVDAIAVYTNQLDEITIKQRDFYGDEHVVCFPKSFALQIIKAIRKEAK